MYTTEENIGPVVVIVEFFFPTAPTHLHRMVAVVTTRPNPTNQITIARNTRKNYMRRFWLISDEGVEAETGINQMPKEERLMSAD